MEQLLRTAYILEPTLKMKDFLLNDYQLYVVFVFVCVFWLKKPVEPDGIDNLAVVPVLLVKSMKFLKICI